MNSFYITTISLNERIYYYYLGICRTVWFLFKLVSVSIWRYFFKLKLNMEFIDTPPFCLVDTSLGNHSYLKLKSVKFHYVEAGSRHLPLVIFLHGFPDCWLSWYSQITALSKHFRIICLDLKGFGDSEKPSFQYSYRIEKIVTELKQFITVVKNSDKCTLVGHDLGALIGWFLVTQECELIDNFVAICGPHPNLYWNNLSKKHIFNANWLGFAQIPYISEYEMFRNSLRIISQCYSHLNHRQCVQNQLILKAYNYTFSRYDDWFGPLNYFRNLPFRRILIGNRQIEIPVLLIAGKQDFITKLDDIVTSSDYCKKFLVKIIENAKHYPHQENPDEFNKILLGFLLKTVKHDNRQSDYNASQITKDIFNRVLNAMTSTVKLSNSVIDSVEKRTSSSILSFGYRSSI